jgi:hypothetical protein
MRLHMINYENMRGSTIEGVSKDRHDREIKCLLCAYPEMYCIEYRGQQFYFDDVENAGDFIDLLRVAK